MAMTQFMPIETISIGSIDESPTNPRKVSEGIEELAKDIEQHGLLQPVLVRPVDSRYELVFGARRLRACKLLGMDSIPAITRTMPDDEVLEVQLMENTKRSDITPLEEADGIHVLHVRFGFSAERIAERIQKSPGLVYRRIKLAELVPEGRAALTAGKITLGAAEAFARVPQDHQVRALQELLKNGWNEAVRTEDAQSFLEGEFLRPLEKAPFSLKDGKLVPEAGACSKCPKRTGAQVLLFDDMKPKDSCIDRECYAAKVEAYWKREREAAEASGRQVLEGEAARQAVGWNGEYVRADDYVDEPDRSPAEQRERTFKEVLGTKTPAAVLARLPDGEVVSLLPKAAVRATLPSEVAAANVHSLAVHKPEPERGHRQHEKTKAQNEAVKLALEAIATKASKRGANEVFLRLAARGIVREMWNANVKKLAASRDIKVDTDAAKSLFGAIGQMKEPDLVGLIAEAASIRDAFDHTGNKDGAFADGCKTYDVDANELVTASRKGATAAAKAVTATKSKSRSKTKSKAGRKSRKPAKAERGR